MTINTSGPFNRPVTQFLFIKAAGIADPARLAIIALHFTPFIFPGCDPQHFITTIPERDLTTAGRAIPMRIDWFGKPDTVFETECPVCQCSDRAYIDHISTEIIIDGFGNIGRYLCMISSVQYTMHTVICQLI